MNGIACYAFAALDRALDATRPATPPRHSDEIAGLGPEWACHNFGRGGHDYGTCGLCHANFQRWLHRGARA